MHFDVVSVPFKSGHTSGNELAVYSTSAYSYLSVHENRPAPVLQRYESFTRIDNRKPAASKKHRNNDSYTSFNSRWNSGLEYFLSDYRIFYFPDYCFCSLVESIKSRYALRALIKCSSKFFVSVMVLKNKMEFLVFTCFALIRLI